MTLEEASNGFGGNLKTIFLFIYFVILLGNIGFVICVCEPSPVQGVLLGLQSFLAEWSPTILSHTQVYKNEPQMGKKTHFQQDVGKLNKRIKM